MPSSTAFSSSDDSIAPTNSPSTYSPVASAIESPAVRRMASHSSLSSSTGSLPRTVTDSVGTASTAKESSTLTTRPFAMAAACS